MFVITGGGSGIGKSLALSLANKGLPVLIIGRRETLLQATAALSSNIVYFCADISSLEGVNSILEHLKSFTLTALINNAGTLAPLSPLKDVSLLDWQQAINTNLNAVLYLTQGLYKQLTNGRVLNIGSGAAHFPIHSWGPYCVSKAALLMLTKCWQLESSKVSFANVMPGIIDTPMQAIARSPLNPDFSGIDFYQRLKDEGRLVSPETVASFLSWLLLETTSSEYVSQEWDIYDSTHHSKWLKPPHEVLHWDF